MKKLLAFALMLTMSVAFVSRIDANPPPNHQVINKSTVTVQKNVATTRVVHSTNHNNTSVLRTTPIVHHTPFTRNSPHVAAHTTVRVNFQPAPRFANYNVTHGSRFAYGTFYSGRVHTHWSVQRWDPRYRCYLYWDPCVRTWYYWNQPAACYYPVTYCPQGVYSWGTPEPMAQIPIVPQDGVPEFDIPQVDPMQTDIPPIPAPVTINR